MSEEPPFSERLLKNMSTGRIVWQKAPAVQGYVDRLCPIYHTTRCNVGSPGTAYKCDREAGHDGLHAAHDNTPTTGVMFIWGKEMLEVWAALRLLGV